MPNPPTATPSPRRRITFTAAQHERARRFAEAVLADAVPAYEIGALKLFREEVETYLRLEVDKMLYEPELPCGGDKERRMIERLKKLAADKSWDGHGRAWHAIAEWQKVLPANPAHPGRYYVRRAVTPKDKANFSWLTALKESAHSNRQWDKKWFAQMLLDGLPEAVSDFEMECLFLLRKADREVDRLVRFKNVYGEVSSGPHHKGCYVMDAEAFRSPEKYRGFCLSKGNFSWGGNQVALQMLHRDFARYSAYRVINQVDSCGWHRVLQMNPDAKGDGLLNGIWFNDDCAYANGEVLKPDEDGIYWYQGEGYYLNRKGRESNFVQKRPKMRPDQKLAKDGAGDWAVVKAEDADKLKLALQTEDGLREFYRDLCRRFFETLGSYEGWLMLGSLFAYAAAPELFEEHGQFPGLWIHGQAGSGKTKIIEWLMHLWGFSVNSGIGLLKCTPVGLLQEQENYSNLPLWADEYRNGKVSEDKEAILRDGLNRVPPVKWSPDGVQRVMKTAFVVSGESTSTDAALRSRYPHAHVSATKRLVNHLTWMDAHKDLLFIFGRVLLERRADFTKQVRAQLEVWMRNKGLAGIGERDKFVHGVGYASWVAMSGLMQSHGLSEIMEFKKFMVEHSTSSAADVTSETNINIFWTDLLTAFKAGEVPVSCFRLDATLIEKPDWAPNQGRWRSYRLYIDRDPTVKAVQQFLVRSRDTITLSRKDLRDQLSKTSYWIEGGEKGIIKKFGPPGDMTSARCWGIDIDKHPMGRQDVSDAEYEYFIMHKQDDQPDPRMGQLFTLIHALENEEDKRRKDVT